ncbi:MAG: hypothetical protein IJ621_01365 [Paludibacteraceae bacterium]|nr:hypothetical protein [Paludibacteraceae bacterium]
MYDGRYVKLTAKNNTGFTFKEWVVSSNITTKTISSNVIQFTTPNGSWSVYAIFTDNSGSGSGSGGGSRSSAAATKTASAQSVTVNRTGTGAGKTINYALPSDVVDMGTAGYWRTLNVGGQYTSSTGDYYQWGSTTKNTYASSYTLPTTADLVSTNDAATTVCGTGYCTPTKTEWDNLISGCTWTKNTYTYTVTSSSSGNSIEIQHSTGSKQGSSNATSTALGWYWTSSYNSGNPYICAIWNTKATRETAAITSFNSAKIYYACCIRPIYNMTGTLYTLTINVVNGGTTYTYKYKGINGQQVRVTASYESGYNAKWNDNNTDATSARTFTISSNATYTVTYTSSVSYVTATFNNWDGSQLAQYTNVVSGSQPTYSGAEPTRPATQTESEVTTYTFTGWSPTLGNISSNTTYTAQFSSTTTPRTYTIRFLMDDGETVLSSAQVVYNGSPIEPAEPTKIGTEEYSYNFTGWTPAVTAVTGDQDYVAVFEQVAKAPKYDLTIGAFTYGSVTLTANGKTDVVPAAGGTYQYEEGTTIIVKAVPAKGYHFNQWNDANTAASRQVSEIAANMTLTPTFAENTPFLMDDTWEQAAFISNCAAATGVLTVTLKDRTYSAGQWATLSVPFNCTLDQEDELYNAVYKLHTLTLAQDGGSVSFEFIRTNVVEANEPYLIVPRHDISTVIFHGVTLTTPAEVSRTTDDRVTFVSGLWKQTISGPTEFYVATGNSLRYASTLGSVVKGNRAFFRKIGDAASAPRRAIMVIDGEEVEVEIAGDAIEEVQDVRKYMENGTLIIERNGVRMDAQGKRIN